jgi:hypothetical protein
MYCICSYLTIIIGCISRILDIFVQLSSSSNRFGRIRERKNKLSNSEDSRFRVSISERPSDLLWQRTNTSILDAILDHGKVSFFCCSNDRQ